MASNPNWKADPMSTLERIGRGTPAGGVYGPTPNGQQLARLGAFRPQNSASKEPTHDRHHVSMDDDGSATLVSLDVRAGGWIEPDEPPNDVVRSGSRW